MYFLIQVLYNSDEYACFTEFNKLTDLQDHKIIDIEQEEENE